MTLEELSIENDYNPFFIFDSNSKIISLNTEAQYLLGKVDQKEIYSLATNYAPASFGFKTTFIDLSYDYILFFGLSVGYIDEERIAIKLYQKPSFELQETKLEGELVNIYTLIDLCISSNSITKNDQFIADLDPSIPEIKLDVDGFVRLLNKIFESFDGNKKIYLKLSCRIGEHLVIDSKKYSLFSISVEAKQYREELKSEIRRLAKKSGLLLNMGSNNITLNVPMITK